ncbi:MAG: FeoB-associated Cys-rich membrane protein [Lachnospiraceae bacterium]|nr:FeoB-associated Cys-rich membrane protein [Lachnospiraceae bacterium]
MANVIVVGVLLIIIGAAVCYIVKAKKSGVKCIGCPAGGSCSGNCGGDSDCSCGCHSDTE